jgi:hypothetical protein
MNGRGARLTLIALASGFAVASLLTACGDDGSADKDTTTTSVTTSTTSVQRTVQTSAPATTAPSPGLPATTTEGDGTVEVPIPDIPSPPAIPSPPPIPAPPAIPSPPPIPGVG